MDIRIVWISYGYLSNKDTLFNMRSYQTQTQLLFSCSEILPSCQQTKSHPFVLRRYCKLMRVSKCIVYIQREKCYIFKINGDHLLSWCIVLTNSDVREAPESQVWKLRWLGHNNIFWLFLRGLAAVAANLVIRACRCICIYTTGF